MKDFDIRERLLSDISDIWYGIKKYAGKKKKKKTLL